MSYQLTTCIKPKPTFTFYHKYLINCPLILLLRTNDIYAWTLPFINCIYMLHTQKWPHIFQKSLSSQQQIFHQNICSLIENIEFIYTRTCKLDHDLGFVCDRRTENMQVGSCTSLNLDRQVGIKYIVRFPSHI